MMFGMKILFLSLLVVSTSYAFANNKAIYGADSRIEVVQSKNPLHHKLANSVAAMVKKTKIKSIGNGVSSLSSETLEDVLDICSSARFAKQQAASDCTGFLVAPNLIATAGHCIAKDQCKNFNWVFDYKLSDAKKTQVGSVKNSNIYSCKRVVDHEFSRFSIGSPDWAVIELDRPVINRAPLKLSTHTPDVSSSVFVIGTPGGIPLKVANGKVRNNFGDYFSTNLDTFGGNSGSPVFDTRTGSVAGILVRGDVDYKYTWLGLGCGKVSVYGENDGGGEQVTAIDLIKNILKSK